jgi:type VI secretion system FHA domain protein
VDEPWVESKNPLFQDDLSPSHGTLMQTESEIYMPNFESGLQGGNQSPLSNSYIAPSVSSSSATSSSAVIPETFSFDDLWNEQPTTNQVVNTPIVNDDFDDFLGAAISRMGTETEQPSLTTEIPIAYRHDAIEPVELPISNDTLIEPVLHSSFTEFNATSLFDETETHTEINPDSNSFGLFADNDTPIDSPNITTVVSEPLIENNHTVGVVEWTDEKSPTFDIEPPISAQMDTPAKSNIQPKEIKIAPIPVIENTKPAPTDSVVFNAFLQGAKLDGTKIQPEQQAETLHRIGQMFRKLIDGTVAVLRSRAEFKSLCRVNMTVIQATNNNPLRFTVSTDDVLRQLLENRTDGFMASTTAIEESFNDIMNHQLAMQAGIQASLTDLLHSFDPKIIEKQFEQGLVLQKKAKCWESYEKTYHNTVEEAVENFFGEAFVDAYEKQMRLLTKSRKK